MENIFPEREPEKAKTLFHTTVYQLRKSLKRFGFPEAVVYQNDSYSLNLPVDSDLQRMDEILGSKRCGISEVREVLSIYEGDFLEQEDYHWAIKVQNNYKDRVMRYLIDFAQKQLGTSNRNLALKDCLNRLCSIDPFSEKIARLMIMYYGNRGDRCGLDNFYIDFTNNLWREMGLRPVESTVKLYRRYMKT